MPAGYDSLWRHGHLDTRSFDLFGDPDHPWALWETSILPSFCIPTTPPAHSGFVDHPKAHVVVEGYRCQQPCEQKGRRL